MCANKEQLPFVHMFIPRVEYCMRRQLLQTRLTDMLCLFADWAARRKVASDDMSDDQCRDHRRRSAVAAVMGPASERESTNSWRSTMLLQTL